MNAKYSFFIEGRSNFKSFKLEFGIAIGLFLFGTLYNLHFAFIGFHPLDGSIVFDGGWRILNGQIPFRDFFTPAGILPSLIQSLFFLIFGVGWLSYFLHSSLVNGAMGVITYLWIRSEKGDILLAGSIGFVSTILFYPPVGFPYIETHSFFFSIASLYFAGLASKGAKFHHIFGILFLATCAFLSKQIPTLLLLPGIIILLSRSDIKSWKRILLLFSISLSIIVSFFLLAARLTEIDLSEVYFYLFEMPSGIGMERIRAISGETLASLLSGIIAFDAKEGHSVLAFLSLVVIISATIYFRKKEFDRRLAFSHLSMSFLFLLSGLVFTAVTRNQPQIGYVHFLFSFAFFCLFIKDIARLPLHLALLPPAFFIVSQFHTYINKTRFVHDMIFTKPEGIIEASPYKFKWKLPERNEAKFHLSDYFAFLEFARKTEGNILYLGDLSVLLGLSGKQSFFPSLWLHPDLSFPGKKFPERNILFQRRVIETIRNQKIRYVIIEGDPNKLFGLESVLEFFEKNRKEKFMIGNLQAIRVMDSSL